ncbi:hypothetical protein Rhopal_000700-T1 [Rhodotorula paludigena]|uniref:XPA C-terminal domain-containing protein n=1 Tax=Rhodotorula paludigena TaxID=86838 RepID=A0AAV5GDB6_9BASI|nr:hypothetical protein Rhopal_000700-T1 [Rhodotorula paludigena]
MAKRKDPADSDSDYVPDATSTPPRPVPTTPKKKAKARPASSPTTTKRKGAFKLFDLPGEIIDAVLGSPDLHIRDHLALAATCRALRSCYYRHPTPSGHSFSSPIWRALLAERPFRGEGNSAYYGNDDYRPTSDGTRRIVQHLWSREDRVDPDEIVVLTDYTTNHRSGRAVTSQIVVRGIEWDEAINQVNTQRITKSTAKSAYKLNDGQLAQIPHVQKRNPHYRGAAPMQLFNEARIESLAFRVHGGALEHATLLRKREATAAKIRQTRRDKANGTWVSPAKKRKTVALDADDADDNDSPLASSSAAAAMAVSPTDTPMTPAASIVTSSMLPTPASPSSHRTLPFLSAPAPALFSLSPLPAIPSTPIKPLAVPALPPTPASLPRALLPPFDPFASPTAPAPLAGPLAALTAGVVQTGPPTPIPSPAIEDSTTESQPLFKQEEDEEEKPVASSSSCVPKAQATRDSSMPAQPVVVVKNEDGDEIVLDAGDGAGQGRRSGRTARRSYAISSEYGAFSISLSAGNADSSSKSSTAYRYLSHKLKQELPEAKAELDEFRRLLPDRAFDAEPDNTRVRMVRELRNCLHDAEAERIKHLPSLLHDESFKHLAEVLRSHHPHLHELDSLVKTEEPEAKTEPGIKREHHSDDSENSQPPHRGRRRHTRIKTEPEDHSLGRVVLLSSRQQHNYQQRYAGGARY